MTGRTLRHAGSWAARLALVALGAAWLVFLRPMALGGPADYLVIRGDSMEPTYVTGDLVIVRAAEGYGPGDVVAYRVPAGEIGAGRVVIHRIVGPAADGRFVLQGDNNPTPDPWQPRSTDIVGRAWIAIPVVGRVLAVLHQPAVIAAGAVALLVAGWVVRATPSAAPGSTPSAGRRTARPIRRPGRAARTGGTLTAWMRSRPRERPAAPIASSSSEADSAA